MIGLKGFPCGSAGKNPLAMWGSGRPGFGPWAGKIPWRRERLPTPVFWLRNPTGCRVCGIAKSSTGLRGFHFHIGFKRLKLSSSYWTLLPALKNKPLLFCFVFLFFCNVGSQVPDQGSNPHPLHLCTGSVGFHPLDWQVGPVLSRV